MPETIIHPTALVSPKAQLGAGVEIGPFAVVEDGAAVGDGCRLAAGVVMKSNTTLGAGNIVREHAVLGGDPQHTGYRGEPTFLRVGDRNIIGEYVTFHRAYKPDEATIIGDDNYFMGYTHVGHDSLVGNHCVLTGFAALAGHTEVEDRAILAGYVGAHQFVRIGTMAMIGGGSKIGKDAVPYMTYLGTPARPVSVNLVGLRRNGVPEETRTALRRVYKILFLGSHAPQDAIKIIRDEVPMSPEVEHVIEFIEGSRRGIAV